MPQPLTLAQMVALSLTGTAVFSPDSQQADERDPRLIAGALADAGWTADRIAAMRDEHRTAGQGWPAAIPAAARGGIGAAQLLAVSRAVLEALGVTPEVRVRDSRVPANPRDRVLMADRPPHHGAVG